MIHIYYLTLLVLTALTTSFTTLYVGCIKAQLKRYFTRTKSINYAELSEKVELLDKAFTNVTNHLKNREKNLKQRVRAEVLLYLEELKNK